MGASQASSSTEFKEATGDAIADAIAEAIAEAAHVEKRKREPWVWSGASWGSAASSFGAGVVGPVRCGLMVADPRTKRRRYRARCDERPVPAIVVEGIERDAQYQRLLAIVLERTSALERVLDAEQLDAWLRLEDALFEWVYLLQHRYFCAGTRMRGGRPLPRRPRR